MNESPGREQVASDTSDFSDDDYQAQPSRHGSLFSTIGESDIAQISAIDRDKFSDEGEFWLYPKNVISTGSCC